MTPEEIKRYLALPGEFRDTFLFYDDCEGFIHDMQADGWMKIVPNIAERLAIASMVVGLRKSGCVELFTAHWSPSVCKTRSYREGSTQEHSAPSDFLALLAACEAVAKEAK